MVSEWRGEDAWSRWLLHERFGDNELLLQRTLAFLAPIRDRVLDGAELRGDDVVLDVGAGDGLVGFGALDRVRHGQVVFTDISPELLSACERIAADRGELQRCRFVQADAADLARAVGTNFGTPALSIPHMVLTHGNRRTRIAHRPSPLRMSARLLGSP